MATILIVDDRPLNREFLVTLLGYRGHRLLEAADGAEALALARAETPDLVIADILMPTMDGYEFVHQLRADRSIAHTQVIFYTAYYHEREALALAHGCGVAHILTKPSEPEVVLRTVDQALEGVSPPPTPPVADEFDREHIRLMTDKLSQTAGTLRKVNLQQAALIEIGLQIAVERDPQRLLETFCQSARDLIGAQYSVVGILGEQEQTLHFFFVSGMDTEKTVGLGTFAPEQAVVLETLLTERQTLRLRNPGGNPIMVGFPSSYPPIHALLAAPIVSPMHTYGWIALTNKLGAAEFSDDDEQLLAILAALVGRIYENGRLYRAAQRYAEKLEQEVAERQRTEDIVRRSEQRYRHLVETARDAIFTLAVDGTLTSLNPAFEAIIGWTVAERLNRPFAHLIHPDDLASVQKLVERVFQGADVPLFELRLRAQSGEYISVECTATRQSQDGETVGLLGIARDITGRQHLEAQFRQAQKMEAIGRLAGGVAHDFNNLLTAIIGHTDLALETLPPNADERDDLQGIRKTAERAASLTHQLLAFARQQIIAPRVISLNDLILDMDTLLRRLIGEDIDLVTRPAHGLGMVQADRGQFEQVVANLAVNARDAMPQGGKITIETHNVDLDETYTMARTEIQPGRYVLLAVSDTGVGMDAKTQGLVFEPFFTTKELGKGTGLGLATVYGIVKQNNGHIGVYSEPDHGTTFKIYLPRVEEMVPAPQPQQNNDTAMRGTETVLLVEDEDVVRALALRVLQMYGYTVLEASDGDAALLICEQYEGPIHLVVTDVVMPRMSGRQLAERLASLRPKMRVLYISGYTDNAIVHHGVLDPDTAFLQKPFTPTTLARKVREVLG
jgi:PAS domain S-box-containing protein